MNIYINILRNALIFFFAKLDDKTDTTLISVH